MYLAYRDIAKNCTLNSQKKAYFVDIKIIARPCKYNNSTISNSWKELRSKLLTGYGGDGRSPTVALKGKRELTKQTAFHLSSTQQLLKFTLKNQHPHTFLSKNQTSQRHLPKSTVTIFLKHFVYFD